MHDVENTVHEKKHAPVGKIRAKPIRPYLYSYKVRGWETYFSKQNRTAMLSIFDAVVLSMKSVYE